MVIYEGSIANQGLPQDIGEIMIENKDQTAGTEACSSVVQKLSKKKVRNGV